MHLVPTSHGGESGQTAKSVLIDDGLTNSLKEFGGSIIKRFLVYLQ